MFLRFVTEFEGKSMEFEGSAPPRLFRDFAKVSWGGNSCFLINNESTQDIRIALWKDDWVKHLPLVVTFLGSVLAKFAGTKIAKTYQPEILVETRIGASTAKCKLEDLNRAIGQREATVYCATRNRRIPISRFSKYVQDIA